MSNPLSLFRRYQKVLLAVFGVMIMFAFVVVPVVMDYMDSNQRAAMSDNEVVITWTGGKIREDELQHFRTMRRATVGFLDRVVAKTYERSELAQPKAPGMITLQNGQRIAGIGRMSQGGLLLDDENLVRTKLLAAKAARLGIVVSDAGVLQYVGQLCDGELGQEEIATLAEESTGDRITADQIFDHLRTELLAQEMSMIGLSGAQALTPAKAREYYDRLNRRLQLDVLPIKVENFLADVSAAPGDKELRELYEKHKYDFPNPALPDPGFSVPQRFAFEYVKIDFQEFLDEEIAKLTEEQIQTYYEENKESFRVTSPPATSPPATSPDESADPAAPADEGEKPAAPAEGDQKQNASENSAEPSAGSPAKPSAEQPDSQQKDGESVSPNTESPAAEKDQQPESPPSKSENSASPGESDGASAAANRNSFFVSTAAQQEPPAPNADPPASDPPAPSKPEPVAEEKPAAESDKPAAAEPGENTPDPAQPAQQPAEEKPVGPDAEKPATGAEAPAPKYEPLEDVRERIQRGLASRPAQERMDDVIDRIRKRLASYLPKHAKWVALREAKPDAVRPQLDLSEILDEFNLQVTQTPLITSHEVGEHDISEASDIQFTGGGIREITFADIAFNDQSPLYKASQLRSMSNVNFVYWKTDEEEASTPEFADIKQEVVLAWKRKQAVQLAKAEAQRRIDEAQKRGKTLRATFNAPSDNAPSDNAPSDNAPSDKGPSDKGPSDKGPVAATNSFTWMGRGSTPMMSFGEPTISDVSGVEMAGREFMQAAYALKTGQMGVAVNQPETFVYAIQLVSQSPPEEQLRETFVQTGRSFDVQMLAMREWQRMHNEWYEDLESEMKVVWNRDRQNRQLR